MTSTTEYINTNFLGSSSILVSSQCGEKLLIMLQNLNVLFLNCKHFYNIARIMSKKNTPGFIQEHLKDLKRWSLYKKGMCETCEGLCCYMPVEIMVKDLIRMNILDEFHLELSEKEQIKEALKHPNILRYTPSTQKFTLAQKPDSSCIYLDKQKKCTIYDVRPDTCRNHPKIGPRPNYCAYLKKEAP